uniref:Putative secreted protein n=1 Tax=Anopheles marajoara TaxID=58244 RepID=A0A2M4CAY8_9DIPT
MGLVCSPGLVCWWNILLQNIVPAASHKGINTHGTPTQRRPRLYVFWCTARAQRECYLPKSCARGSCYVLRHQVLNQPTNQPTNNLA